MKLSDINKSPEARKFVSSLTLGILLWLLGAVALLNVTGARKVATDAITQAGQVLNIATKFKASPDSSEKTVDASAEPLTLISSVVEDNGVRDRVQQLGSNRDGSILQLEKLYGSELAKILRDLSGRGLSIRTAEIKAMPMQGGTGRLFSAMLILGVKQ